MNRLLLTGLASFITLIVFALSEGGPRPAAAQSGCFGYMGCYGCSGCQGCYGQMAYSSCSCCGGGSSWSYPLRRLFYQTFYPVRRTYDCCGGCHGGGYSCYGGYRATACSCGGCAGYAGGGRSAVYYVTMDETREPPETVAAHADITPGPAPEEDRSGN